MTAAIVVLVNLTRRRPVVRQLLVGGRLELATLQFSGDGADVSAAHHPGDFSAGGAARQNFLQDSVQIPYTIPP